jgi:hypothetical protein
LEATDKDRIKGSVGQARGVVTEAVGKARAAPSLRSSVRIKKPPEKFRTRSVGSTMQCGTR